MGPLTFYFDRNFGKRFPEALNKVRPPARIKWHNEQKFPSEMKDDEWLKTVGQRGWIVFSQDRKFHKVPLELAAVKQFRIRCFYFPFASDKIWDAAILFVRRFDRICELTTSQQGPFVYRIYPNRRMWRIPLK